jgi:hypothetical protein
VPDLCPAAVDNVRNVSVTLRLLGALKDRTVRAASVDDGKLIDQYLWAFVGGLDGVWRQTCGSVSRD